MVGSIANIVDDEIQIAKPAPASASVLFVCSEDLSYLSNAVSKRGFTSKSSTNVREINEFLRLGGRSVAVLDTAVDLRLIYETYELLAMQSPPVPALLLVRAENSFGRAIYGQMLGRFDEIIDIDDTFNATYFTQRIEALLTRAYPDSEMPLAPEIPEQDDERSLGPGQIISVFSPKGGVGKTTIATNLAIALVTVQRKRVVLIDADLYFGTIGVLLGVTNGEGSRAHSIYDLAEIINIPEDEAHGRAIARAVQNITPDLLEEVWYTHSSGLKTLLCPPRPDLAEQVPSKVVENCISVCSSMFDYVIVDTPETYGDLALSVFDLSSKIIVVLVPEMGTLKNTYQFIAYAQSFGWADKLVFVLNRANSGRFSKISPDDIEHVIQRPLIQITGSGTAVTAMNRGHPLVTSFRDERIAKDIVSLSSFVARGFDECTSAPSKKSAGLRGLLRIGNRGKSE